MIVNATKMYCGGCGGKTFEMYTDDVSLWVECSKCKSVSSLTVSTPKIEIGWTDKSDGILCKENR
jgi:hypothetical protein